VLCALRNVVVFSYTACQGSFFMGLIRKTFAIGSKAIVPLPGVGIKFFSNGEAIRREARRQTKLLSQMGTTSPVQEISGISAAAIERPRRACPECAEMILAEARKCRYCSSPVQPLVQEAQMRNISVSPSNALPITKKYPCPHCGVEIATNAIMCKSCRKDI